MTASLALKDVKLAPNATGVYFFKKNKEILYIGKAVSLKSRLISHIENAKLDPKEALIIKNSDYIDYILTDSEFKALLLESALIQKHLPKYNSRWKDNKSYLYIKITAKNEFPKVYTVRRENDRHSLYFGPFPSTRDAEKILSTVRRLFPFCRQKNISGRPCFYSKIGLCNPCPNAISQLNDVKNRQMQKKIYRNNIRQLIRILEGNSEIVLKDSYHILKILAKNENFEEALKLRNHIQRFEQLISQTSFTSDITENYNRSIDSSEKLKNFLQIYFSKIGSLKRIECYDVSNLFQKEATASLVVFTDGMPDKNQYRRFKIKSKKVKSDFEMMEETFQRRFKQNWPHPDLLVVDGGRPQVLKVKRVMKNLHIRIPLLGIAKHPDRLVIDSDTKLITLRPSLNDLGFNLIRALRDEAHRFAKKYHLLLRYKKMML